MKWAVLVVLVVCFVYTQASPFRKVEVNGHELDGSATYNDNGNQVDVEQVNPNFYKVKGTDADGNEIGSLEYKFGDRK